MMQRIKCRALRAVLWLSVPERTIGHHVMPAEAGESLYDREMKEAANWDGLRFRDCASTSVKLPARTALI
jgi:hypothetical protein